MYIHVHSCAKQTLYGVHEWVHMNTHTHTHTHTHTRVCVYLRMCVHTCVCTHVCMHLQEKATGVIAVKGCDDMF